MKAPLLVIFSTVLFTVSAFPPFNIPEAAYLCTLPLLYWACLQPRWKTWLISSFIAGGLSWFLLLFWLRHVTWGGLILLSAVLALFYLVWAAAVRFLMPALAGAPAWKRLWIVGAVAAAWVVSEWLRGWMFGGFPWLPLAASQWERPVLLQMLPWTGAAGLSFVLVFFSAALVAWFRSLLAQRSPRSPFATTRFRLSAELYCALILLLGQLGLYMPAATEAGQRAPMFRVGIVQPKAPILLSFNSTVIQQCLDDLSAESLKVAEARPDFILWPETALTLLPLTGDPYAIEWAETLAQRLDCKILGGALAHENERWFNALYVIDPILGVKTPFYAKRKLVPFGEYVPFEDYLPFIRRVVPYEGRFYEGTAATPLTVFSRTQAWEVGGLICYEDVFPELARASVQAGAQVLAVVTNNAWFGEEGGAYQHAAHSVLRASENRRPLIRAGNAGWSGWIDEHGHIRERMTDAEGSIYFRGNRLFEVTYSKAWLGNTTFYTRHGNFFSYACLAFLLLSLWALRKVPTGNIAR